MRGFHERLIRAAENVSLRTKSIVQVRAAELSRVQLQGCEASNSGTEAMHEPAAREYARPTNGAPYCCSCRWGEATDEPLNKCTLLLQMGSGC